MVNLKMMGNKIMIIFFIVDGGFNVGLGHVYQSITFAQMLTEVAEICFLTKSDMTVVKKINDAGFQVFKFFNDSEILGFLTEKKPNIVIFDKIDVSETFAKDIKMLDKIKLVIFTNMTNANRHADIAVTADIGSNFKNICFTDDETKTTYCYGPKYWILRKQFHEFHNRKKPIPKIVDNILVIFGGSDPANLTTLVVRQLLNLQRHTTIDVILGASFGHVDSFNQALNEYRVANKTINIHRDVANVAQLMHKADVVIVSPGLSAFEALFVGTPILVMPQDLLQKETYQGVFKVIDRDEIAKLLDSIANMDFTYPDQEQIIDMDIAGGTKELIKLIIGDENNVD